MIFSFVLFIDKKLFLCCCLFIPDITGFTNYIFWLEVSLFYFRMFALIFLCYVHWAPSSVCSINQSMALAIQVVRGEFLCIWLTRYYLQDTRCQNTKNTIADQLEIHVTSHYSIRGGWLRITQLKGDDFTLKVHQQTRGELRDDKALLLCFLPNSFIPRNEILCWILK